MEIGILLRWEKIKASIILICLLANHLSGLFNQMSPWSSQCVKSGGGIGQQSESSGSMMGDEKGRGLGMYT